MIKPEQVPDEVVRQFSTWQFPKCSENLMRRMIADALNAWPGMHKSMKPRMVKPGEFEPMGYIALPLPTDDTNE